MSLEKAPKNRQLLSLDPLATLDILLSFCRKKCVVAEAEDTCPTFLGIKEYLSTQVSPWGDNCIFT